MNFLGNILWLVLGGLLIALIYYFVGLLMCITIIGIPFGIQLFKLGTYALWPFGKELVDGPNQPGCVSIVMNLIASSSASPSWGFPGACSISRWRLAPFFRSGRKFSRYSIGTQQD